MLKLKLFLFCLAFSLSLNSYGKAKTLVKSQSNLQTDISFEDALVNAKHHGVGEAVITIGTDKVLNSLLGIKTDFKKRIKKSFYKF